jgi:hypothetical protein
MIFSFAVYSFSDRMPSLLHSGKQEPKTKEVLPIIFVANRSMSDAFIGQNRVAVKRDISYMLVNIHLKLTERQTASMCPCSMAARIRLFLTLASSCDTTKTQRICGFLMLADSSERIKRQRIRYVVSSMSPLIKAKISPKTGFAYGEYTP